MIRIQGFYTKLGVPSYGTAYRYAPPIVNQVINLLPDVAQHISANDLTAAATQFLNNPQNQQKINNFLGNLFKKQ